MGDRSADHGRSLPRQASSLREHFRGYGPLLLFGPAFIGVSERKECAPSPTNPNAACTTGQSFDKESRVAIAPTFGLGFSFYVNKWNAIGFEWRALPFAWNTGGFDTKGGGPDNEFPDNKISADDRQFRFNQMLTLSYNFYLPTDYRVSE